MDRSILGSRLRRIRELRGLTLRDLEHRSGVSFQYISALEHGAPNANVTLSTLEAITEALGCVAWVDIRDGGPIQNGGLLAAVEGLSSDDIAQPAQIAAAFRDIKPRTKATLTAAIVGAAQDARE